MSTINKKRENSFESFKRQNTDEFIIRKTKEMMYDSPNLTLKQIGKKLGYSDATISRAFDIRTIDEKKVKKSKIDFKGLLDTLLKGGIGLGGISVLNSPTLMKNLQEDIEKFLIDNRYLNYGIIGLGIIWEKFVKVKINSPKNDLSELEIIIRLIESNFSYIIAIALGIFALIGQKDNILQYFIDSKAKFMEIFEPDVFKTLFNVENLGTVKDSNNNEFPALAGWRDIYNAHSAQKGLQKQSTFVQNIHDTYGFYYPSICKGLFPTTSFNWNACKEKWFSENGIPSEQTPTLSQEDAQYIDETNEQMQNEDWMNSAKWNV